MARRNRQTEQRVMNEYRVTFLNKTELTAVREDTFGVTKDFESEENPIVQVQRTRTNINVAIPSEPLAVFFSTVVTPQAADEAYCMATPTSYTVQEGTPVLFEAIAGEGYEFVGWFLSAPIFKEDSEFNAETPVSTDEKATIIITAPAPGQERIVEARFAPGP